MRKKIDNRIRILIENGVATGHRNLVVIVGDKGRDQVCNVHSNHCNELKALYICYVHVPCVLVPHSVDLYLQQFVNLKNPQGFTLAVQNFTTLFDSCMFRSP